MDYARCVLGIEFGSTNIKAVLLDEAHQVMASGAWRWENQLVDGVWTYDMATVREGMQAAYARLREDAESRYGGKMTRLAAIGISGMMHGYLPFDRSEKQLARFRTWRNTMTAAESEELSELLAFNIPQRYSIAHLYQEIRKGAEELKDLSYLSTLAGTVHRWLTGEAVLGIGDASGIFPVDASTGTYDADRLARLQRRLDALQPGKYEWKLEDVLPRVLVAGDAAGFLTEEGRLLLDPTGQLEPGIPFCPPEGDAATGMVSTNAVRPGIGNISVGTSIFANLNLTQPMKGYYPYVDMVATPEGAPVAMVHCNNGASEVETWVNFFGSIVKLFAPDTDMGAVYQTLFEKALEAPARPEEGLGVLTYNYLSGEHITGLASGAPLVVRRSGDALAPGEFVRAQLYAVFATLALGLKELEKVETVRMDYYTAQGGLFKTPKVAQKLLASALQTPIYLADSAEEGGAYGIAVLAAYLVRRQAAASTAPSFAAFLDEEIFHEQTLRAEEPDPALAREFARYLEDFEKNLALERALE